MSDQVRRPNTASHAAMLRAGILKRIAADELQEVTGTRGWPDASSDRFRKRLEARAARRLGLTLNALEGAEASLETLLENDGRPEQLIVLCGAVCQSPALRLIIEVAAWRNLSELLGFPGDGTPLRDVAISTDPDLCRGIKPVGHDGTLEAIADAIRADGMRCWECWAAQHSSEIRRYLDVLAPKAVPYSASQTKSLSEREILVRANLFGVKLAELSVDDDVMPDES